MRRAVRFRSRGTGSPEHVPSDGSTQTAPQVERGFVAERALGARYRRERVRDIPRSRWVEPQRGRAGIGLVDGHATSDGIKKLE